MKIGFIGAGKMAEALIAALVKTGIVRPADIIAGDVSPARLRFISRTYRVMAAKDNRAVVRGADMIWLAVKPQELSAVLEDLAPLMTARHVVVSIAAGRDLAFFAGWLPRTRVVRVMPNLACQVGAGMSVFCANSRATAADRRRVARMLAAAGRVLELPEKHFDVVTALSGSGPAFFAYMLERLVRGAVAKGLSRSSACLLAEQTMMGAAKFLLETGTDPDTFIKAVASPKGTTAEGLAVLEASDITRTLADTIAAATRRGRELRAGG